MRQRRVANDLAKEMQVDARLAFFEVELLDHVLHLVVGEANRRDLAERGLQVADADGVRVVREVLERVLEVAYAPHALVVQAQLVGPNEVGVRYLLVGEAAQQERLDVSVKLALQVETRLFEVVPVDPAAAVPVEELEGDLQLVLGQGVQLLPAGDALEPRAGGLLVLLVRVLRLERHAHGEVVRGVLRVRDDLPLGEPRQGHHVHDLELVAEELHHVDAALPGFRDGRGAGGHVAGPPEELVDGAAPDLPHRARDAPDLAEVPRVEVAEEDDGRLVGAVGGGEVREALHDLRHLADADGRLRAVVGVLRQVRGHNDEGRLAGPPAEEDHEATSVPPLPAQVVGAVDEVDALRGEAHELRAPPEDAAAVQRGGPRALVEAGVPHAPEAVREVFVLVQLHEGDDVGVELLDLLQEADLPVVPPEVDVAALHRLDLDRRQQPRHVVGPGVDGLPLRVALVVSHKDPVPELPADVGAVQEPRLGVLPEVRSEDVVLEHGHGAAAVPLHRRQPHLQLPDPLRLVLHELLEQQQALAGAGMGADARLPHP
mmetsp:Transcript_100695/g.285369  ORF Transcript_100695/g.285369 Transcript_100695/m.285369 type:complete len:545 (-) Transcript_100695:263-1897(-)|eukprot:CAMPEP_0179304598 /NCGR_PEP_ID=MMETSP0797-20121207/49187_1 /TAXON_ID=47934 /ORGANISM="Dinophysis acuminata, Strain DAEP01" /LENGTH=544 /DNA_ID=CAMNT_0021014213 /DNA_START=303 /DNA_END=1937 /DNA_ORIENTATION=+